MPLPQVLNLHENHLCRAGASEAAVYSLEAVGDNVKRFRGNFRAELRVRLTPEGDEVAARAEEATPEDEDVKYSEMVVPLVFSKEQLVRSCCVQNSRSWVNSDQQTECERSQPSGMEPVTF